MIKTLASGTFGEVSLYSKQHSSSRYAIKVINYDEDQKMEVFIDEVYFLYKFKNINNVLQTYGAFLINDNEKVKMMIIMEVLKGDMFNQKMVKIY